MYLLTKVHKYDMIEPDSNASFECSLQGHCHEQDSDRPRSVFRFRLVIRLRRQACRRKRRQALLQRRGPAWHPSPASCSKELSGRLLVPKGNQHVRVLHIAHTYGQWCRPQDQDCQLTQAVTSRLQQLPQSSLWGWFFIY